MRVLLLLLLFSVCAAAENLPKDLGLMEDEFLERQAAERELIEWAREEALDDRIKSILSRYFTASEPEERFRLGKVLFEIKKDTLIQKGEGFVGISMDARRAGQFGFEQRGVLVTEVIKDTPAERVGLMARDLIVEIDGKSIGGVDPNGNLMAIVQGKPPGTQIRLTVERGEERLQIDVPLMNRAALKVKSFDDPTKAEVDLEKADELLRGDFRRWMAEQKKSFFPQDS